MSDWGPSRFPNKNSRGRLESSIFYKYKYHLVFYMSGMLLLLNISISEFDILFKYEFPFFQSAQQRRSMKCIFAYFCIVLYMITSTALGSLENVLYTIQLLESIAQGRVGKIPVWRLSLPYRALFF